MIPFLYIKGQKDPPSIYVYIGYIGLSEYTKNYRKMSTK